MFIYFRRWISQGSHRFPVAHLIAHVWPCPLGRQLFFTHKPVWLVVLNGFNHLEKHESQWEGLSHIFPYIMEHKIHVWNHQPTVIFRNVQTAQTAPLLPAAPVPAEWGNPKVTICFQYSYGHLPVVTGYKWAYTFYKWGYKYL